MPSLTNVQVPALPETLHDWQRPHDGELQQTPSTQVPAAHGIVPQGSPIPPPLTQWPPLQTAPGAQSEAVSLQVVLHPLVVQV